MNIGSKSTNVKFFNYFANKDGNLALYTTLLSCHVLLNAKDICFCKSLGTVFILISDFQISLFIFHQNFSKSKFGSANSPLV